MSERERNRIEEMRTQLEQLSTTTDQLRKLGEREEFPAVEHNARRIQGIVAMIEQNLPPELIEDSDER
jgi:hypothetical protein